MKTAMKVTAFFIVCSLSVSAFGAKVKLPAGQLFGPTGVIGDVSKTSIKVNGAQPGSPAEGKVNKGDEIIGVGSKKFKNPTRDMAAAIDVAEAATGGKMTLMLKKGGKTVDIMLPVLGSYSATAPYKCRKTDKIITMTAESLLKNEKGLGSRLNCELLGLLATGEKKYIDAVAKTIPGAKFNNPDTEKIALLLKGETDMSYVTWPWGYYLITLGEYYLMTGDKSVLPAIKTYALALAKGQDAGGMYGHRLISPKRNGRLPGYGQMNQPSLTCFMGMIFAAKCGIKDPALTRAIQKTYRYVESHVGEGGFPYGVHGPNSRTYNNNGTSGSAAMCMALLKKSEGAKFFSQITATTYDGFNSGHASTYFNPIWTSLGASLSGPEVTQQFFKKALWYHNLRRCYDGSWYPDWKEGPHEGTALLAYCVGRKALFITGKKADESIWVKGKDATDVIMRSKVDYKSKTAEELMKLANHPLPQVRRQVMGALGSHREELSPTWIKYLKEGSAEQKKLAMTQYGWWHPIEVRLPQLEAIGAILRDTSQPLEVRTGAAGSLAYMGEPALKYYPDIVKLLSIDVPGDPLQLSCMGIGKSLNVLCKTPFASKLVPDKKAHYKGALKLIRHKRQHARGEGLRMLADMPIEDFHLVVDDIMHVIEDKDSTYHSYHNPGGPVTAAITILANLNIKEGIDLAMQIEKNPSGKGSFKMKATWAVLQLYGAHAKNALEEYKKRHDNRTNYGRHTGAYNKMVKAIEEDKNPKKLISLKEAIAAGKK